MSQPATILVVDDQSINIKVLRVRLERAGLVVLAAKNGRDGVELANSALPDVILMDIMMPEMDGIEACKQLKQNVRTKDIPVIFISAKDSKQGKLEGLEVGAADYITKPIDLDETLARVNTQLRIRASHRQNLELSRRLSDTRHQIAISHVAEGIAHNLNNLLGVVSGYLELMKACLNSPEKIDRHRQQMSIAVDRMVVIVQQLMTVADTGTVRKRPYALSDLLENAVRRFKLEIPAAENILIENHTPDSVIDTNEDLFEDMLIRLLNNSWESYGRIGVALDSRPIKIHASELVNQQPQMIRIQIMDEGCGIPPEIKDTVFDPFVTTESQVGRGMGLAIVRHAIESMGGKVSLQPNVNGGTITEILHPI